MERVQYDTMRGTLQNFSELFLLLMEHDKVRGRQ